MTSSNSRPKPKHPFPFIKDSIPKMEDALMGLPFSPVWIHEKAIFKLCRVPKGQSFGERASLTCLLKGIEKGYCGSRKHPNQFVKLKHHIPGFSSEKGNGTHISFQQYGDMECYSNGNLCDDSTSLKPRWFSSGKPLTNIATQREIVAQLLGEDQSLSEEESERRRLHFKSFVRGDTDAGGFSKFVVPRVA